MQFSIILSVAVVLLATFEQSSAQLESISTYLLSYNGVIYCKSHVCKNGGGCKPDNTKEDGYTCHCQKGKVSNYFK